jgi:hypothetical protein
MSKSVSELLVQIRAVNVSYASRQPFRNNWLEEGMQDWVFLLVEGICDSRLTRDSLYATDRCKTGDDNDGHR